MVADALPTASVRRVLVIKLRHHGDVLLASPVLGVLKRHIPHADIDALVYADTAPMLEEHPALAQLHTIDRAWKKRGPAAHASLEWQLLGRLRARGYDLVVHLTDAARGAWLTRLLGARFSVAPRRPNDPWWWRRSFTHLYPQVRGHGRHTVERNLDALRRIGLPPADEDRRLVLVPGAQARERVASLLKEHGLSPRGFVHLHPASRWLFKCWPVQSNAALIDALHAQGLPIVLTAAPAEAEMRMAQEIAAAARAPVVQLAGQLSLREMAALTEASRVFVGVDSAPMHIAAAVGTPTVGIFGPSSDLEWGPWRVASRVVASTVHPCRPCGLDGCGGGKVSECLTTLPVERVLQASRDLLAQGER